MDTPTQLDAWLQGFPREAAEARIRALEAELAGLRQVVSWHQAIAGMNGGPAAQPKNRPAAIRRVLRENHNAPMKPSEIKAALIEHGWHDKKDDKYFYASMSTMYAREQLERSDGRYQLTPRWANKE